MRSTAEGSLQHRSGRYGRARVFAALSSLALVSLYASAARAADANSVLAIDVEPRGAGRVVRIRTSATPTFTVFRLSDPMRVVVDISGGELSRIEAPIAVEDGVLGQIAVRQFSADGFRIARIMVGFDSELPYEVFADGNAVVVASGEAIGAAVGRVVPPPVAPIDRAASERLEAARAEADEAARRAAGERKAAEEAASIAKRQQEEAQRVAAEADRRAAAAAAAKSEAEQLRKQAVAAAEKDRAAAQKALAKAEERLSLAEEASRRVASERADAERLAAEARRAQSDAEAAAADAQAKAKQQVAELEDRIARAQSDERAAEQARQRAAKAKTEAQAAQRAAEQARVDAERVRGETAKKLEDIAAREARLDAERRALTADRQKLESERLALIERERKIEQERAKQADSQRLLEAERRKQADSQRLLETARAEQAARARQLEEERAKQAERARLLEQERAKQAERERQLDTESARLAGRQKQLERERARLSDALGGAERERKKAEEAVRTAAAREKELAAREKQARADVERTAAAREKELAERERRAREKVLAEAAAREKELIARERLAKEAEAAAQAAARKAADDARAVREQRLARTANKDRDEGVVAAAAPVSALVGAKTRPAVASIVPTSGAVASEAGATGLRFSGVRSEKGSGGRIVLAVNGEPRFETQRIDSPWRLVVDLEKTTRGTRKKTYDVGLPWAARVRLGDHGETLRAVVDLTGDIEPVVTTGAEGVVITAGAARTAARASDGAAGAEARPSTAAGSSQTEPAVLRDVRFERRGRTARIIVDLGGAPTALVDDRSSKTWVLQLRDTRVPKELERSLDTAAYETVVRMVSTYQASESPLVVNVVANLAGTAEQKLTQEGRTLVWEIEGEAVRAPVAASATPQTAGFTTEAAVLAQTMPRETRQKRVNMRLKDADLVNVIRFIADVTGENIIVSEDVRGKVTVNLRNVPWEQALDTILKSRGYDKVRANNIIRIASADEIQKERERDVARRRAQIEAGETFIRMIPVNYAIAREIMDQLKGLLSPRGTIQVDDRTNTLIIEDLRENIQRVVELARRLDRQTPQVLIEARIVEAASNFEQELGIQWGGTGQASAQYGNPTGLSFPSDIIVSGAADDPTNAGTSGTLSPGQFAVNLPAAIGAGSGGGIGFIFGSAGGSQLLSLRLSALERNGSGRIISSPRIATLDNRTAKIAQGVDIPISTVSAAGTNTRFIPANLELEVTPHVTNDGTVLLRLKTSKNEPDFGNRGANGDPTIVKKSAETEVMVRDGDTAVIGGIYTRNTSENYAEVPFFSKIPVLGWLFKKKRSEERRAELLVFITPRIINRESALVSDAGSAISPTGAPPALTTPPTPSSPIEGTPPEGPTGP